jgi:hypothetical protein
MYMHHNSIIKPPPNQFNKIMCKLLHLYFMECRFSLLEIWQNMNPAGNQKDNLQIYRALNLFAITHISYGPNYQTRAETQHDFGLYFCWQYHSIIFLIYL